MCKWVMYKPVPYQLLSFWEIPVFDSFFFVKMRLHVPTADEAACYEAKEEADRRPEFWEVYINGWTSSCACINTHLYIVYLCSCLSSRI